MSQANVVKLERIEASPVAGEPVTKPKDPETNGADTSQASAAEPQTAQLQDLFKAFSPAPAPQSIFGRMSARLKRVLPDTTPYEFQAAAIEIVNSPPSPIGRAVSWIIILSCMAALIWAWIGHVDVVATARGRIIPADRTKVVQAPEAAQITAIHVREGQHVEAGTLLLELSPTEIAADRSRLQADLLETRLTISRLKSLMAAPEDPDEAGRLFAPPEGSSSALVARHQVQLISEANEQRAKLHSLGAELDQRQAEVATASAELDRLNAQLPFMREQAEAKRGLAVKGAIPRLTMLEVEQQLSSAEKGALVQQSRLAEAQASVRRLDQAIKQARAEFERRILADYAEAEQRAGTLESELIKAEHRAQRLRITAPVSGHVQQVAVNTLGGVVTAAQSMMMIVPDGAAMEIEARIENKDIGLIQSGQLVEVKVDAYDFTKYGLATGRIRTLSRDAVPPQEAAADNPAAAREIPEPVYMARILLDSDDLGKAKRSLFPGMGVTAEIKIGRRRIIDYLLSPIMEHAHDSLREI